MSTAHAGLPHERALTLSEAIIHLAPLTEWQVRQKIKSGTLPVTRLGSKIYVFPSAVRASALAPFWRD